MGTIFMKTENYKTNEPHRFRLSLVDKLNVKDHDKIWHWLKVFITQGKTLSLHIATINLKSLLQLGMINFICLMDLILFQIFKITLSTILKNMKL